MTQLLTLKRQSRWSGNPEDESIIISSNHRTLNFSKTMARELREALTMFIESELPSWENETARLVREQAEERDRKIALGNAEKNKSFANIPSFTTLEDLA